jgi:hypothetical protein
MEGSAALSSAAGSTLDHIANKPKAVVNVSPRNNPHMSPCEKRQQGKATFIIGDHPTASSFRRPAAAANGSHP